MGHYFLDIYLAITISFVLITISFVLITISIAIIKNIFANGAEEIDVQSLISTQIKDSEIRVEHKTQSVVNQNKIVTKIPIFLPDV